MQNSKLRSRAVASVVASLGLLLSMASSGCATYVFGKVGTDYFTAEEKEAFGKCNFLYEGPPADGEYWMCSTVVDLAVANPSMREKVFYRDIKPWKGAEAARDQVVLWHKDDGTVVDVKPASAGGLSGHLATFPPDKDGWKPAEFVIVEPYPGSKTGFAVSCQTHMRPDMTDQATLDRCAKWMTAAIRVAKSRH